MANQSLEPNTADDFGDGPTELVIDHGVVKKVRRGRQKVERPKPDPFKILLSGESERTGLGLRRIHSLLPSKVLKDWGDVDEMVEHCLRRPPDVAVNPQLAAAIQAVYQAQPDKEGFIGLGIRSGYESSTHNGTYGTSKHQPFASVGRHGTLDTAFERMARATHPDALSPAGRDGKHGEESKPAARRDVQP